MENVQIYWNQLINLAVVYTPKLLIAIITLIVGLWLIRKMVKVVDRIMVKKDVDRSLHDFMSSLAAVGLKILLILSVISMVGIETTSFIAILASVGFAIGMALQGSLGNFAGGVLILFLKPYKVGDYIETQSFAGTVQSIQIFSTIMLTPDNKRIIIPNGSISNAAIINYTAETKRRLDLSFSIGYKENVDNARALIDKVIKADSRILLDPAPMIAVGMLADSGVNFTVRVWCNTDDYWNIFFDIHEKIKKEFDENGIEIPFPQRDIHVYNH